MIYYVTITDQNNCSDTGMIDLAIRSLPNAMLGPDQEVLLGMTITLDAVQDMSLYSWDPPQYLSDTHISIVNCTPLNDITYTLTIIDQYGCQNTEDITITVYNEAKLAIPKAFTPNADGRNDIIYYYAKGMAQTNLKVFNRWGQMVFESFFSMMMSFTQQHSHKIENKKNKLWEREKIPTKKLLRNQTILIIGYGHIGKKIALNLETE